ncbi:SPOR domain-containing protein [Peribacillus asahii]|nr:SPOR domain-containing protein [Peribacillus asahii]
MGSRLFPVGAFSDKKNAESLAVELKKKGYPAVIV